MLGGGSSFLLVLPLKLLQQVLDVVWQVFPCYVLRRLTERGADTIEEDEVRETRDGTVGADVHDQISRAGCGDGCFLSPGASIHETSVGACSSVRCRAVVDLPTIRDLGTKAAISGL